MPSATSSRLMLEFASIVKIGTADTTLLEIDSNTYALNATSIFTITLQGFAHTGSIDSNNDFVTAANFLYTAVSRLLDSSGNLKQAVNSSAMTEESYAQLIDTLMAQSNSITTAISSIAMALLAMKVPREKMTNLDGELGVSTILKSKSPTES